MSMWTSVSGLIRIDAMDVFRPQRLITVDDLWTTLLKRRLDRDLPFGSEGTLCYDIQSRVYPRSVTSTLRGYVAIYGDLRDFGEPADMDQIVTWLDRAFAPMVEAGVLVHSGIVCIEAPEVSLPLVLRWVGGEERFVRC